MQTYHYTETTAPTNLQAGYLVVTYTVLISLGPRSHPAFPCFQYGKAGEGLVSFLTSLVPRPPPPPPTEERPGTHCLRMRKIFRYIFRKKLHALPCPYAVDYTNQEYRVSLNKTLATI